MYLSHLNLVYSSESVSTRYYLRYIIQVHHFQFDSIRFDRKKSRCGSSVEDTFVVELVGRNEGVENRMYVVR